MDRRIRTAALAGTALAAAIGGTAVADQLLSSRDIKDGSIKLKDLTRGVRKQLETDGRTGEQGPQGPQGAKGEPGPAGQDGPRGPRGISAQQLGGRITSTALTADPSFHTLIGGNGGALAGSGITEPSVQIAAPEGSVSAGNLEVRQSPAPSDNLTFTLRVNGVNTAVSCTVTTAQTACGSAGASAAVSPGDLLSLGVVTAGSKTTIGAAFSLDLNLGT